MACQQNIQYLQEFHERKYSSPHCGFMKLKWKNIKEYSPMWAHQSRLENKLNEKCQILYCEFSVLVGKTESQPSIAESPTTHENSRFV